MVLKESNFWKYLKLYSNRIGNKTYVCREYIHIYIYDRLKEKFEYI